MSWNEPGGDKKDPWSGRGDQKGPPDLDEVIRSLQEKLGAIFGAGGRGGGKRLPSMKGVALILLGVLVVWGLSGFYIVNEGNRGVETRFGKYFETAMPGLNWHMPFPIESVEIVNVEQQRFIEVGYRSGGQAALGSVPKEALMLTEDENIIDVRLAVQYVVKDAKQFLFNVLAPDDTLKQVIESALRGVIGKSKMDFVLTEGRSEIVAGVKTDVQKIIDAYEAGILVTTVNLQDAQPPEEVQSAFEDAIKSREDQQRLINEAQAYANEVIPKARGAAARVTQEAEAYKATVIAQSEGEASRFTQLLTEYHKAPEVTRKRLYLEAMESVFSEADTVLLDVKGGNNLVYLPLDRLTKRPGKTETPEETSPSSSTSQTTQQVESGRLRAVTRGREGGGR